MFKFTGRILAFLCLFLLLPVLASAQISQLTSRGSDAAETADAEGAQAGEGSDNSLADAIREAARSGVSVVIIDRDGNLVSTAAPAGTTADGADATGSAPGTAPAADPSSSMKGASALMKAQAGMSQFRQTLRDRVDALPNSLNEVRYILRATSPTGEITTYVRVFLWCALFLVIGRFAAVEIYGKRLVRRFVVGRVQENPQGYLEKMPFLVFRFFMGIGGTLFGMLVAYILLTIFFGTTDDLSIQFTVASIFLVWFLARMVSDVWRMILSPFLTQYRIPVFSDADAKKLYYWAAILAGYAAITVLFSTWIHDFGLNYNVYAILYGLLSLVGALLHILMILFNARAITNALRGGKPVEDLTWVTRTVSHAWAPVLIFYMVVGWLDLAYKLVLELPESLPMVAGAYGVFLSGIVVYGVINYLIERYFDRRMQRERVNAQLAEAEAAEDMEGPHPRWRPDLNTYEDLARRVAGILAFVAGAYALLRIWDPKNSVLNENIIENLLDVIAILFIGYVIYHFFRIWIDTKIAEESVDAGVAELGDEGGAGGASRLATLLPLFRGAILAVVVVSIGLIALMELGVNVSPLFAGAGVVGLAVGFGAQTLVRDIFSGAFFLIDDAFRKGEYIDIESVKGTVEKISVRSFQLRHHLGALHTIPFGEIKVLTNYSRDWVMMKLPLRVTYDTDVETVRKLIKKLGQELLDDPEIGPTFLQPLKSQGVIEMQDSAMIIRVKFMTKPGDQWVVRKKVYERIRELFAEKGIRFAHREVTVRLADGEVAHLSDAERKAVTGAVQAAMDEDMIDDAMSGDDR